MIVKDNDWKNYDDCDFGGLVDEYEESFDEDEKKIIRISGANAKTTHVPHLTFFLLKLTEKTKSYNIYEIK